jgi:hypothetical protein
MDMKKLLMILALSLPIMAQEAEAKESVGKKVVRTIQDAEWSKSKSAHQRDHDKKGGMKRGGMEQRSKRMMMAKRKKMAKKRAFRSAVRIVVIGGIAYYVGLQQGKKHRKDGKGMKRRMGDKK